MTQKKLEEVHKTEYFRIVIIFNIVASETMFFKLPHKRSPSLILFNSLAGHSVDEAVTAGIHVPDAPRDAEYGQTKTDHYP